MKLELLAPAKNLECGIAAIDHGADAVYIGAQNFGARHAAGNTVADIAELCRHAHQFGAKVYATVNTIIYDDEMTDAVRLIGELADAGVDAVLVQDMGLLKIAGDELKDKKITFHASTQTDNRSVEKVKWLHSLGFRRVVLARELSLKEIAAIHEAVPDVELEVFVHGALCVSYSGQCYASQYCFGRSANRGECAQLCRMKYSLIDADGERVGQDAYYLSLKDMCQIDNLQKLADAGACSFKIEGRLKDVAYVKNVVAAYSERLNEIVRRNPERYQRASMGKVELAFEPDLKKTFNRGYTNYFLNGREPNIASFLTPKAVGEFVGKVKSIAPFMPKRQGAKMQPSMVVAGTAAFANGDGLCFMGEDGQLKGFRVNRADGNRLFPHEMPRELRVGMSLYRNQDQVFDTLMARQTAVRTIPIMMSLNISGNVLTLSITDGSGRLKGVGMVELPQVDKAQKPQMENIKRQLAKLGGTIYSCEEIRVDECLNDVFIPSSILADLRRKTVAAVTMTMENTNESFSPKASPKPQQPYYDKNPYLYNIANKDAATFYAACGVDKQEKAFELQHEHSEAQPLMQCRHCIRYSMGYCLKNGGRRPTWNEPLSLRLADGREFQLEFDCKNCQMNVRLK